MEIGTKIILCSFERATRAKPMKHTGSPSQRSEEEVLADLQPDVGLWLSVAGVVSQDWWGLGAGGL